MKPAPFAYHRPSSREEVDLLLAQFGSEAKILAGGQSLIPILNMRLATFGHLVDLNHLRDEPAEPAVIGAELVVGPLVRQAAALESALVAEQAPLLQEALQHVAHPAIRSRGTVVGSVVHGDPAAELPAAVTLLAGAVQARSRRGTRQVPAGELWLGALENTLAEDEWADELRLPVRQAGEGFAFEEFARRSGDYALCGVAARVRPADGKLAAAVAYLGMSGLGQVHALPPMNAADIDGGGLRTALAEAAAELEPGDDLHASSRYRRWLALELGLSCVRRASKRAMK
ncbi:MAG: FAD binding domain-containing protein [Candidatus Dormibacteraeota bacterium]|nr:FAD binding domain-containing protein [Candidatus Dormibacteraeota bacterium]